MFTNLQVFGLTTGTAGAAGTSTGFASYTSLIMLVAMFAIFYFMLIRPQKKKDKEIKQMRESLAVGDDVVTIGGVVGKVVKVSDTTVIIELPHAKQRVTFSKWAIGTVEKKSKDSKVEEDNKVVEKIEENTENKDEK